MPQGRYLFKRGSSFIDKEKKEGLMQSLFRKKTAESPGAKEPSPPKKSETPRSDLSKGLYQLFSKSEPTSAPLSRSGTHSNG